MQYRGSEVEAGKIITIDVLFTFPETRRPEKAPLSYFRSVRFRARCCAWAKASSMPASAGSFLGSGAGFVDASADRFVDAAAVWTGPLLAAGRCARCRRRSRPACWRKAGAMPAAEQPRQPQPGPEGRQQPGPPLDDFQQKQHHGRQQQIGRDRDQPRLPGNVFPDVGQVQPLHAAGRPGESLQGACALVRVGRPILRRVGQTHGSRASLVPNRAHRSSAGPSGCR